MGYLADSPYHASFVVLYTNKYVEERHVKTSIEKLDGPPLSNPITQGISHVECSKGAAGPV